MTAIGRKGDFSTEMSPCHNLLEFGYRGKNLAISLTINLKLPGNIKCKAAATKQQTAINV